MRRLLMLPGWQDSGPQHWQTCWQQRHGGHAAVIDRVEQDDWQWPRRGDWMARLDEVLLADDKLLARPAVLVAHSLGCHLVVAWAAHSQHTARVAGAWLVAPPDLDSADADVPPPLQGWRKVVRQRLVFPAHVLLSRNDPYGAYDRGLALAEAWGAETTDLGEAGHVNPASGHGEWPEGWVRLQSWLARLPGSASANPRVPA